VPAKPPSPEQPPPKEQPSRITGAPRGRRRGSILLKAWTAAQRVNLLITQTLHANDAWTPHYALLSMIAIREPVTPTELAREMGLRPTTTSDYVEQLVELGHIQREPNPDDRRSYLLTLTEAGWEAFRRANEPARLALSLVEENLGRPLEEIEQVVDELILALETALERTPPAPGDRASRI
jgi:DNA-binding MarR family transcriptional regulator